MADQEFCIQTLRFVIYFTELLAIFWFAVSKPDLEA
jgi:hypothetical protein